MPLYLRSRTDHTPQQIWDINSERAVKLGVGNPDQGPGSYYERGTAHTIWHALEIQTSWLRADDTANNPFKLLKFEAKTFYPRIARPMVPRTPNSNAFCPSVHLEKNVLAMGIGQATALMRRLEIICQTVHPHDSNMTAFGHEIRSLLILASTEAETHWRGILRANDRSNVTMNTNEYVKILPLMKLDQYSVSFPHFPWLAPMAPFAGWDKSESTKSLPWYDAYNGIKHNRELEFEKASLFNAFMAVSACVIMLAAQFGRSPGLGGQSELSAFFRFESTPEWDDDECYIMMGSGEDWRPVSATF